MSLAPEALLQPSPDGLAQLRDRLQRAHPSLMELLASGNWRDQLLAAAILVLEGADARAATSLWSPIDGISWVAPQLVATAFLVDDAFAAQAESRLLDRVRRPPKMIGALVHAYHRLPSPSLPVVAQLLRHERVMATEEARIGVRVVDWWLDRVPAGCHADERERWRRQPRQPISRSS
jgi:hypothetical protein